jgi:hypothetical protein
VLRFSQARRIPLDTETSGRKDFFLKKEAKTFAHWRTCREGLRALQAKVFWFVFSKKNCFLPLLLTLLAAAAPSLEIGSHVKFGRVVVHVPRAVQGTLSQRGDTITLHLAGAGLVPGMTRAPRNVLRITGGTDELVLQVSPGSQPRLWRDARQVVVDIYNPGVAPPGAPPAPSLAPLATQGGSLMPSDITLVPLTPPTPPPTTMRATTTMRAKMPSPLLSPMLSPMPSPMPSPVPSPGPAAASAAGPTPGGAGAEPAAGGDAVASDALVAQRVPAEGAAAQPAILVPFGPEIGAAAFPRGNQGIVVFDDSKPVDLAALRDDPVFGSARVTLLAAATQITMNVPPGAALGLRRRPEGWVVTVMSPVAGAVAGVVAGAGAGLAMQGGVLTIGTRHAASSLVLDEAASGGRLLVGTVSGDDAGVSVPHQSPEFSLRPSWAGVVLAAQSDRLSLRAAKAGFLLATASPPALAAVAGGSTEKQWGAAADLTRHFDFTPLPVPALLRSMRAAIRLAAASPRMARSLPRLHAAEAMMSLGLAREAAGALAASLRDDSAVAAQGDTRALLAMAHFLAGCAETPEQIAADAQAMADPALGQSDELALWRGVMPSAPAGGGPDVAKLGAAWRLLLAYPERLQARLAPLVALALMRGGQTEAAQALVDQMPARSLDAVRAALLAKAGRRPEALALLDRLGAGRDRLVAAAALRDATELRLAGGQMTAAQAAEALDRHLYAWRDDATEIDQRLRIGALRAQSGNWRQALNGLRATEQLYPAAHDRVHSAQLAVIGGLLQEGQAQRMPALDLVALVEESADLLGSEDASSTLAPVLADKLMALDLPDRAAPILSRLMKATAAPAARAALGARLAALRLDQGNAVAAISVLDESGSADLPDSMRESRMILRARALADSGQQGAALALLGQAASEEGLELRARLLEQRHDWAGAVGALQALARASMPADGPLTEPQQDVLLRLASDAVRGGDMAVLQQLQAGDARRLTAGSRAALFQALVQQPIQALGDLPRAARETAAARAVAPALASYQAR